MPHINLKQRKFTCTNWNQKARAAPHKQNEARETNKLF